MLVTLDSGKAFRHGEDCVIALYRRLVGFYSLRKHTPADMPRPVGFGSSMAHRTCLSTFPGASSIPHDDGDRGAPDLADHKM